MTLSFTSSRCSDRRSTGQTGVGLMINHPNAYFWRSVQAGYGSVSESTEPNFFRIRAFVRSSTHFIASCSLQLTSVTMPRLPSPPKGPRRRSRSPSPRRDRPRDKDRNGDRDRGRDYDRPRSRSPPPRQDRGPRKPKELSFYKKSSSSMGSFSSRRDLLDDVPSESARDRMERRDRGEVPARFGGTREHGVRNTMSTVAPSGTAPSGMGSFRRSDDPLDRIPLRGEGRGDDRGSGDRRDGGDERGRGDRDREERLKAMNKKPQAQAVTAAPSASMRFIEVIANDRMGRKGQSPSN